MQQLRDQLVSAEAISNPLSRDCFEPVTDLINGRPEQRIVGSAGSHEVHQLLGGFLWNLNVFWADCSGGPPQSADLQQSTAMSSTSPAPAI